MNENCSESQLVLNPNVYLNYLQPTVANEYELARNICLVTLGALAWDILSSLPSDWTLIRASQPSLVLFAYCLSRPCALAVVLMSALAKTGPIQNCGVTQLILYIFWVFACGSSSYLFLKRVHAVFLENRIICHSFTVLWIAGVGATTLVLPGSLHDYYQIANTRHCINVKPKSYVLAAFIVPVVFDAFVHIGISFKIRKSHRTTKRTGWKILCYAETLPHLSRAILQGGQQYYMITNSANITRSVLAVSTNISPVLQLLPLVPAVAITSAMACRVFRNLKLEALQKTEVGNIPTMRFADRERVNVYLPKNTEFVSSEVGLEHY